MMAITCVDAYRTLRKGNENYVTGQSTHPNTDISAREKVVDGQHPFAVVLCCSDSRVVPELIFDTGIGDLFVIRVAGNVLDDAIIASIEYAVANLGSSLVVVLGHEKCGAVTAAVNQVAGGHLIALTDKINPAIDQAQQQDGDLVDNSIRQNAINMAEQLQKSAPVLRPQYEAKTLKILPAYYALTTGKVAFLKG
ncbi:carbonic anhydrase [Tunicatimonas pelagia]|uniref:carbonic anhydrase n=1 Tax=Tunicatimonas pelagia TaxID=931531 RepID=UPI0026662FC3|nr:carbonic anhydrase [Tunicatimonas pelagia]WKN45446.1 carbonic anhydrase [Tunicatimonas pelagia]